jgi:threonine/homoserine efflux transporter RhtA
VVGTIGSNASWCFCDSERNSTNIVVVVVVVVVLLLLLETAAMEDDSVGCCLCALIAPFWTQSSCQLQQEDRYQQ